MRKNINYLLSNNSKGYVLISVLVVTMILTIIIFAIQPMILSYVQRAIFEHDRKQAEFTARSTVKAIMSTLVKERQPLIGAVKALSYVGDSFIINNINLDMPEMGSVAAKIVKISDVHYSVIAKATVNDAEKTVSVQVLRKNEPLITTQGFEGMYIGNISLSQGGFVLDDSTDMIITNEISMSGQASLSVGKNLLVIPGSNIKLTGNSSLIVADSIYTMDGTFDISGNSQVYLHGIQYNKNHSPISSYVPVGDRRYSPYVKKLTYEMLQGVNSVPSWVKYDGISLPSTGLLQRNQYYTVVGTQTIANLTNRFSPEVNAIYPVFIVVKNNSHLTISNPIDPPVNGEIKPPRVYFILEGNARLTVPALSCIVTYGAATSTLYVSSSGSGQLKLYGQIQVANLYNLNTSNVIMLEYVKTNIDGSGGGDGIYIPGASEWRIVKYSNNTY